MEHGEAKRRTFLKAMAAASPALLAGFGPGSRSNAYAGVRAVAAEKSVRNKLSCNLYSFNRPLRNGQMTLDEVFELCADLGFDAVDPTAYYFPGYPELPDNAYVHRLKRKAFRLGLDISGTGVRNDFTLADTKQRASEVELVKKWVGFSARFGAPVLRVFSGLKVPEGRTRADVNGWVVDALRECADYGRQHGVMIVLQNHADFVRTADDVLSILRAVDSEWLAMNLDIGSFHVGEPYAQIARIAPHAATWQIKENLVVDGKEVKTDLSRIVRIVRDAGYRGYLPIETLGEGDPRVKVPKFLGEVRTALAAPT